VGGERELEGKWECEGGGGNMVCHGHLGRVVVVAAVADVVVTVSVLPSR
jgi:hypothetical protein